MSSTYTGLPGSVSIDFIRFSVGDTTSPFAFTDEEISSLLGVDGATNLSVAVQLADNLQARYSRLADKEVGDLKISYSSLAKTYAALAARLRRQSTSSAMAPYAAGVDVSDVQANKDDASVVQPTFHKGMMENR